MSFFNQQPGQTGSIFTQGAANQTGSIFTQGGTNQTGGGSNPFGNLGQASSAASQPGQTSNVFGSLGGASSATPQPAPAASSSSFAGSSGTKLGGNSGSNLFGGAVAATATSQPPSTAASNPFGSALGAASKPEANAFGGFGAYKPAGTIGPKAGPPEKPAFPSLLNPNANSAQHQGPAASVARAAQNQEHSAYFNSLLEKNKKRARGIEEASGFNEVPSLQLGLGDISKRIRELGSPQARRDKTADTRAHYLLAASGVHPGSALRDLDAFNASAAAPPPTAVQPEFDPDSRKYVEQMQQRMTMKMINEGIERANKRFDEYLQEHMDMNWEQQKKRVYEHFGLAPRGMGRDSIGTPPVGDTGGFGRSSRRGRPGDTASRSTMSRSVLGPSGMQKSVIGAPAVGAGNMQLFSESTDKVAYPNLQEDRSFREKQGKLAEKVQQLNEARLAERFYPIIKELHAVEAFPSRDTEQHLLDSYKALIEIAGEETETAYKPRKFKDAYLDNNTGSEQSVKVRQRIITGSRGALEKQFFEHLTNHVARNVKEASLGGAPTRVNKVRAYIRVRAARKDLAPDGAFLQRLGDDYCWALIFFLLRSGFYNEAAEYVAKNNNPFKTIDRMFATYITNFVKSPDRRLPPQQQTKINNEYTTRMRLSPDNSLDPYRMACYKILGRCELSKRSLENISQGVEDWIWLQFCLAREANRAEELATEVYGLKEVQETIREIGQRHFSKCAESTTGYGTYFYLQILGGMFENAIDYLYKHSYVSAVHFAIALAFHGLLRVSDFNASDTELRESCTSLSYMLCSLTPPTTVTETTRERPQLNFTRMLGYYTRDFRASNVVAATDYLCLIHLNADLPGQIGKSHSSLCHEALRELVLETREFAQLLGDIYGDGTRVKGAIEMRLPLIGLRDEEDYLRNVTMQAAKVADDTGRTTDAVLLYHLAEDYNSVIAILNRALSDAL
ncbi:MAG: hypothetical protein LQ340_005942, partial [Diploschistes diacapsis]